MSKVALQQNRTLKKAASLVRGPGKRDNSSGIIRKVIAAADDAESGNVGPDLTKLTREQRRRILFGE